MSGTRASATAAAARLTQAQATIADLQAQLQAAQEAAAAAATTTGTVTSPPANIVNAGMNAIEAAELVAFRAQEAARINAQAQIVTTPPLRGGIQHGIAWTGGGLAGTNTDRMTPASPNAYRPTEFKAMSVVFGKCTTGFLTENCFEVASSTNSMAKAPVTLVSYISALTNALTETGQDGVFILKNDSGLEVSLLANSGQFRAVKVGAHVESLMLTGDDYDRDNLKNSGTLVRNTIGPLLMGTIQKFISGPETMTGPYLFMLIIESVRTSTSGTWRNMMTELQNLRLDSIPGENVSTISDTVNHICRSLEGAAQLPTDAAHLVAKIYTKSSNAMFCNNFIMISNVLNLEPEKYTWSTVVKIAVDQYNSLVTEGDWNVKPPQALAGAIVPVQKDGGGTVGRCHNCNKTGHFARNCPNPASSPGQLKDPWKTTAPLHEQPETMVKFDKNYYWCGTCGMWNLTHLTASHTAGKGKRGGVNRRGTTSPATAAPAPAPAPPAAVTTIPAAPAILQPIAMETPPASFSLVQYSGGFVCTLASESMDLGNTTVYNDSEPPSPTSPANYSLCNWSGSGESEHHGLFDTSIEDGESYDCDESFADAAEFENGDTSALKD